MPKFSQVFLADRGICEKICNALVGENFDYLVEIGPGGGALTQILYPKYQGIMSAIEIDRDLVPELNKKYPALNIINNDFMRTDIENAFPAGKIAFIGNLPYDCSTAILNKVLSFPRLSAAVFMFQKEVGMRIMAKPGSADYGVLSISSFLRAESDLECLVKAGSFRPVPAVDSAVLKFRPKSAPLNMPSVNSLLKKAFMHRRKTLVNSLSLCGIDKKQALEAFSCLGIPERSRAQDISPEIYVRLAEFIS
ncbi:MAG: ribosomal RNA small subunit methyltransferase A [Elusimicrobiales bacterium]|nr:ribosomal RNA small subunit methyltransferase A [Elusimicrobiales bacterium]